MDIRCFLSGHRPGKKIAAVCTVTYYVTVLIHRAERGGCDMRRLCGLMLFCFGLGMAVLLFIPETIFTFLFVIGCLVLGYNLFCC